MKQIISNLENVKAWLKTPIPANLSSDDDYMRYIMELMSYSHYLIKVSASMAPNQNISDRGYAKHKAIVVGHLVRLAKLYHGFATHIGTRELELAAIMVRLMYECMIKMEYLLRAKKETFKNFILTSYRAEKETLQNLDVIKTQRSLTNMEKVIIRKIRNRLKKDNLSLRRLSMIKDWRFDGKDFKQIMKSLNKEIDYPFIFGQGSSFIHGNWYEMSIHNLIKTGRYYLPNLEFSDTDPRIAVPVTVGALQITGDFLKWNKSDPDNFVRPIIDNLLHRSRLLYTKYCKERYGDVEQFNRGDRD